MLPDRCRQLLTAYVDGELTPRQLRHVARLLRRSREARQLLDKLQEDAHALRHLPLLPLPADFTGPVLRTIAERRLTPGQGRLARVASSSSWVGPIASWAAAAAVLLILGAASYLYFASSVDEPAPPDMAQQRPDSAPSPVPPPDRSLARQEQPQPPPREKPVPKIDKPVAVERPQVVQKPDDKPKPDVPQKQPAPPDPESALTGRFELFQLDRVTAVLPIILKVSDLEQESGRKNLLTDLRKDSNFRLELPCGNGTRAFDRVQNAARTLHIGLIIDKQAQERIKLKWRTNYVLYLENVTPEELTHFVRQIGAEDRKSSAKKPAEAQIDRLVLTRMTEQHRKELSTLLGIDPTTTPPATTGPLGTDLRKPLSEQTAQQLGKALAQPDAGKPAPKPPEKTALVLAYNPVRPAPGSDEIKRFLETRTPARPGTLRVLIVLRS